MPAQAPRMAAPGTLAPAPVGGSRGCNSRCSSARRRGGLGGGGGGQPVSRGRRRTARADGGGGRLLPKMRRRSEGRSQGARWRREGRWGASDEGEPGDTAIGRTPSEGQKARLIRASKTVG